MLLVQVNCDSLDQAHQIGETLVGERLVASANIISQAHSIFRWNDEIVAEPESVILLKTRADLFDKLAARIKAIHSYSTPCVIGIPISHADSEYSEWVKKETQSD